MREEGTASFEIGRGRQSDWGCSGSDGIPEVSILDDEDSSFPFYMMVHNTSDAKSNAEPTMLHYPGYYDSSGSSSSSKEGVWTME